MMSESNPTPSVLITNGAGNNATKTNPAQEGVLHSVITYYVSNNRNNVIVSSNGVTYPSLAQRFCSGGSLYPCCRNNGVVRVVSLALSPQAPSGIIREVRGS